MDVQWQLGSMQLRLIYGTIQEVRYSFLAAYCLQIYEWCLNFEDEVRLIHSNPWSKVRIMYVLCRYYPVIAWPVLLWAYCINHNPSFCMKVVRPVHALMLPFQLMGQAVVFIRTYGFSAQSRSILACLTVLYAMVVVSNVWLFCIHIVPPSITTYAPFYAVVGGTGCFPDYSAKLMGERIGFAIFAATLMDVFSLAIVSMYCYRRHGARTSLAMYFMKQGFGSFICATTVNVFAMSLYFRPHSTHSGIGLPIILVVSSLMACRLILQLRQRVVHTDSEISRENSLIVRNAIGSVPGTGDSIAASIGIHQGQDASAGYEVP